MLKKTYLAKMTGPSKIIRLNPCWPFLGPIVAVLDFLVYIQKTRISKENSNTQNMGVNHFQDTSAILRPNASHCGFGIFS